MNEKEALLTGILLGDGMIGVYGRQHKVQVTCNSIDDKEFLFGIVKPLIEKIFKIQAKSRTRKDCNAIDIYFYSKPIFTKITNDWGLPVSGTGYKKIPEHITKDANLMKEVVAGFFATDGSLVITNNNGTVYPRIEFQNISQQLLIQVKGFLSKLSIEGGIYSMNRNGNIVYRLQYNGYKNTLKFKEIIGFINLKHQIKFESFKNRTKIKC